MSRTSSLPKGFIGASVLVIIVMIAVGFWEGLSGLRILDTWFHGNSWNMIPLGLLVVFIVVAGFGALRNDMSDDKGRGGMLIGGIGAILAGIWLIISICAISYHSYQIQHRYMQNLTQTTTQMNMNDRAPWLVANNFSTRDQGSIVGSMSSVTHVSDGTNESQYGALITGRGAMGTESYSAVRMYTIPLVGSIPSTAGKSCNFPSNMNKRWNSFYPNRSLNRALSLIDFRLHWDSDDLYAYCDSSNSPVVVMPLFKYSGWLNTIRVPAGVAVYDKDGFRVVNDAAGLAKIQGPTFPESLAQTYRESFRGIGDWSSYWNKRTDYNTSETGSNEYSDANNTDYTLFSTDGNMYYVTPLTPSGSSQSITYLSVIPARQGANTGKMTLETGLNLQSSTTVDNNIRSASVDGDSDWVSRWTNGMKIYEMVPEKNGKWVVSIGLGQVVNYRATINSDGSVDVISRTDGQGSGTTTTTASQTGNAKDGYVINVNGVNIKSSVPLDKMTDAQLLALIQQAMAELQKRHK